MSTGAGNVRELGEDLTSILNSFASMLEGVYFVDEAHLLFSNEFHLLNLILQFFYRHIVD